jgi:hypothetical protein
MKKLIVLLCLASCSYTLTQQIDPSYYTADVINKSQFTVLVKVYKPGAKADEKPKAGQEYTTEWNLKPGVSKYNQKLGWKDQYTYTKLSVNYTVNYGGVNQEMNFTEVYDIPKSLQKKNDFVATIDIQKKTGKEATDYLDSLLKRYPYETQLENIYLKQQKTKGWAWVPEVSIKAKN